MSVLVFIDRDVENGRYFEGFLTDSFAPNKRYREEGKLAYKCYIPVSGKIARVPEMSRYFFYNNLKNYDVDKVYLLSDNATKFVTDIELGDKFGINGYVFEKVADDTIEDVCNSELVLV